MAQDEFTRLTKKERDRLTTNLKRLFDQKTQYKGRTGRDMPLADLARVNKEIQKIENQLRINPSVQSTPSLKNVVKGLSLSGSRPRNPTDPMGNMGEPNNKNFTPTVQNKKVNPENKVLNNLLKKQALDRIRNPKKGYKQFGGEGAGDDSFEDRFNVAPKKPNNRDRLEKSILASPKNQRNQELAENSRVNREANLRNVDDNQNMNIVEQLASKLLGKNVKLQVDSEFNDDGYMTEEQRYHNLNRGGAITPEQKKRMARIAKEYKAKRAKKVKAQPKVVQNKSNKGASPFSDMKKAMANGNRKRTNR